MTLTDKIKEHIETQGPIPFVSFMEQALYAPHLGYYTNDLPKLGSTGDFITAPELTPLFGKALAKQCYSILQRLEQPMILEYGAGTGKLCTDLLSQLERYSCLPEYYYILELSPTLRERQQAQVKEVLPHLSARVIWLDTSPTEPFAGIILANEVLDAMPVHRFLVTDDMLMESYVCIDDQGALTERFQPSKDSRLIQYVNTHLHSVPTPYLSEVNLYLDAWMKHNAELLTSGVMLLVDYGFPRHEYYHPDRSQGTLMCHYQHRTNGDPLLHIGAQDITAHVDFTHVAEAAVAAGLQVAGFTNQCSFLLANDLLSFLEEYTDERALFVAKQAIKQLTHPSEMGELFKVMALCKNLFIPLNGFLLNDKRAKL